MNTKISATTKGLKMVEPVIYMTKTDGTKVKINGSLGAVVAMLVKYGVDATPLEMGYGSVTIPSGEILSLG